MGKKQNNNKVFIPESLNDLKKIMFKRTWVWIRNKTLLNKVFIILFILFTLIICARINLLGHRYYILTKRLFNVHISGIDLEEPVISLYLNYHINDDMGKRIGRLGDITYSGDEISLSIKANRDCWVCIICLDEKGIYPIFHNQYDPSFVEGGILYEFKFNLDETVGIEIYYAIAAKDRFSYVLDIEPKIKSIFPEGQSKGPRFSEYMLDLSDKYTQRHIFFYHEAKE